MYSPNRPRSKYKNEGTSNKVKTLRQREKSSMLKLTDLTNINAPAIYDSGKECKSICFKNTLGSDLSIHSEISSNHSSGNLSEVTDKINKKENFIKEEKVTKECRKRKISTSDPQSEAPLSLK